MKPIRNVDVDIPSNDLNEIKDDLLVIIPSTEYITLTNRPPIEGYFILLSISRKGSADYAQIAVDYNTGQIYTRETGYSWIKVGLE